MNPLRFALSAWLLASVAALPVRAQGPAPVPGPSNETTPPAQGPSIFFPEPEWDFGKIKEGEKAEHVYIVENRGSDILVINNVKASCGCTAAQPSVSQIPAGGKAEIKASFDSRNRTGQQIKHITVESNDPVRPVVELKLTGFVEEIAKPVLEIEPQRVEIGLVTTESRPEFTLRLRNAGVVPLLVNEIKAFNGGLQAVCPDAEGNPSPLPVTIAPGEGREARITLDRPASGGPLDQQVMVYSNDPRLNFGARVTVSGYVRNTTTGRVSINGLEGNQFGWDFGILEQDEPVRKTLTLSNTGAGPLEIRRVTTFDGAPQVVTELPQQQTLAPGQALAWQIAIDPAAGNGTVRTNYFIETDDPLRPRVSFQVTGYVSAERRQKGAGVPADGGRK
jgi:hypothetical protein